MTGEAEEPDKKKQKTEKEDFVPKNILLTGGAGFIGSHVAILLATKYPNYKVVVYDCLDYCACLENLESIQDLPNYKFIKGDISSPDITNYVLREEEIDTVLHFAAQTHVDNSFGNSLAFTNSNIYGTHVLLECCKNFNEEQENAGKVGIQRFVHVSTDEVYGVAGENFQTDKHHEGQTLEPVNPYAATKAAAEYLVKSYFRSFKFPCMITRGGNVYGPHQLPEKLVPKFIIQLQRDIPLTLHGDGSQTRNFLYIKDVASAFDVILHKGSPGTVYNIGGKTEISAKQVAKDLLKMIKSEEKEEDKFIKCVPGRTFNDERYPINSSKLEDLGWKEQVSWEDGMKETVEWYQDEKNMKRFQNVDQAVVAHPKSLKTSLLAGES